tara:strand:+ start:192 stop:446 length:255 start_codon:yes stop_codon:yes gene_type:complete
VNEEAWRAWAEAGALHSSILSRCTDQTERLRMLASAPMFSLWTECRRELEASADEIDSLKARCLKLEQHITLLEQLGSKAGEHD